MVAALSVKREDDLELSRSVRTDGEDGPADRCSHLCLAAPAPVVSRMLTASLLLGGMPSVDVVQSGAGLEDTARHGKDSGRQWL